MSFTCESRDLNELSGIFDVAWAAFAESRRGAIADVQTERNRLARMIFDLWKEQSHSPAEIAEAVGHMMRERARPHGA